MQFVAASHSLGQAMKCRLTAHPYGLLQKGYKDEGTPAMLNVEWTRPGAIRFLHQTSVPVGGGVLRCETRTLSSALNSH